MGNFFSKIKFLDLPKVSQHKKAAELVRKLYDSLLLGSVDPILIIHYEALESFLNLPKVIVTEEALSNRFHYHLQHGQLFVKEHHLLPTVTTQDRISNAPFLPIDIYLDNIRSAHNVGSIIRTTEALRLGSLFFSPQMASSSSKKLQDTAMGTLEKVPIHIAHDLKQLKKPKIAIETVKQATSLYDFIFPNSFTLLFGNEEYGLSEHSLAQADYFISIPLYGSKNSLNVACAFSIVANEIRRQHAKTHSI